MKTKSIRRVMLRWRRGDFAGVQFCRGETAPPVEREPETRPNAKESASGFRSSWRGREE
jgi:hypothetical protein